MKKEIWFDMDGTIADLYGVENWLDFLQDEDTFPYAEAATMWNFSLLARLLNRLQTAGWRLGIISWTSKCGSESYNLAVEVAKRMWLAQHLPSVEWDDIQIVRYGTNKFLTCGGGILFDDEERNRNNWEDKAFSPDEIFTVLKELLASE